MRQLVQHDVFRSLTRSGLTAIEEAEGLILEGKSQASVDHDHAVDRERVRAEVRLQHRHHFRGAGKGHAGLRGEFSRVGVADRNRCGVVTLDHEIVDDDRRKVGGHRVICRVAPRGDAVLEFARIFLDENS